MSPSIDQHEVIRLDRCLSRAGVAIFPADTVYGVCCDPQDQHAADRLYALKGRPSARPAAVMYFQLELALTDLPELLDAERSALHALLPGPVTLLLPNRASRFKAACRTDPATLGLRVPRLPENIVALGALARPIMQSSANLSGQPDARSLAEVPQSLRDGADLVLDGGPVPGTPSTVIDLRDYHAQRRWHVLREGAISTAAVERALDEVA
jgi:L-threonylcarbamoyladenylate synthase